MLVYGVGQHMKGGGHRSTSSVGALRSKPADVPEPSLRLSGFFCLPRMTQPRKRYHKVPLQLPARPGISQKISASTLTLTALLAWAPAHQDGMTIE